jgi:hypothetical protein
MTKFLHWFLAFLFLVCAGLQYNDPDPYIWVPIYGSMMVLCVLAAFDRFYVRFNYALMTIFLLYSLVYIPGVIDWLNSDNRMELFSEIAKMNHLYIEESREFMGLMICVGVLVWYAGKGKK